MKVLYTYIIDGREYTQVVIPGPGRDERKTYLRGEGLSRRLCQISGIFSDYASAQLPVYRKLSDTEVADIVADRNGGIAHLSDEPDVTKLVLRRLSRQESGYFGGTHIGYLVKNGTLVSVDGEDVSVCVDSDDADRNYDFRGMSPREMAVKKLARYYPNIEVN